MCKGLYDSTHTATTYSALPPGEKLIIRDF